MKAKKLILLCVLLTASIFYAGTIHHTMISITEQKVMGHMFKHVMTSGGVEKDEYFIDGYAIAKDVYQQELERVLKKEREEDSVRQEISRRSRIEFADMMQVQIAAKLLNKVLVQVAQLIERIEKASLEKFYIFTDSTIDSQDQLMQLKDFTQQLELSIQKKIANQDFEGLNLLFTKLEYWPERLEKFFQNTVQNAIKKSDDTIMLKELLKLVS